MVYSDVLAAWVGGSSPRTSTNACGHVCRYVDQRGLAAMLTSVQSAGVATEVSLRITQTRRMLERRSYLH